MFVLVVVGGMEGFLDVLGSFNLGIGEGIHVVCYYINITSFKTIGG